MSAAHGFAAITRHLLRFPRTCSKSAVRLLSFGLPLQASLRAGCQQNTSSCSSLSPVKNQARAGSAEYTEIVEAPDRQYAQAPSHQPYPGLDSAVGQGCCRQLSRLAATRVSLLRAAFCRTLACNVIRRPQFCRPTISPRTHFQLYLTRPKLSQHV